MSCVTECRRLRSCNAEVKAATGGGVEYAFELAGSQVVRQVVLP